MRDDNKNDNKNVDTRIKSRANAGSRVLSRLDLPEDASGAEPCVRMFGTSSLWVENHRGVLELGRKTIRLYTSIGVLRITGEELDVRLADRETVRCDGLIKSVEYEI